MKRFIYVITLIFISTMLYSAASAGSPAVGQGRDGEKTYLVGLKNQERGLEKAMAKGKIKRKYKHLTVAAVKMTPGKAKELEKDSDILFVEPDGAVKMSGEYTWNITGIKAEKAHGQSVIGQGIKIAVLDTGIDKNHGDLNVTGGTSFVGEAVQSDDGSPAADGGNANYSDDNGHGTHVAGIIAALLNEKGTVGVAPGADLYSVKVLDNDGLGSYSQVIAGIDWAMENEIDIACLSFGGSEPSMALEQAMQKAYDSGMLLVAAAGNGGSVQYPAKYPAVMAVGAVDCDNKRASFSSTGPEVEIVAPGVGVESTLPGGGYGAMSGTSAAAPHVAGAAALVMSSQPGTTGAQARDMLKQKTLPLGSSSEYGSGLVDLSGLFEEVQPPPTPPVDPGSIADTNSASYPIDKMNFYFNEDLVMARAVAIHFLSSNNLQVREHALKVLGEAGDARDLPLLDEIVQSDQEDKSIRDLALVSILKISARVVPEEDKRLYLLETALKSDYNLAANYAVRQLGKIGGEDARSLAWEALSAETDPARKSVLESVYAGSAGEGDLSALSFPEEFTVDPGVTARYAAPSSDVSAQWDPYDSNETNDSRGSATSISEGVWKTGYIGQSGDVDYFRLTAGKSGEITVVLDGPSDGSDLDIELQSSSGSTLEGSGGSGSDETITYDVSQGSTYYIKVKGFGGFYSTNSYKLKYTISGTTVIRDPYEPNNNRASAKYISLDRNYTAYIDYSGDVDYYRFVPGFSGELEFDMSGPSGKDYDVKLLSSGGSELEGSSGSGSSEYFTYDVTGGNTYYIKIYGYGSSYDSDRSYTFSTSLTNNQATIDMSISAASSVNGGQTYTITATVRNESAVTARDVYAVLNQPVGFWLESGETLLKDIGSISPWDSETVSWRLRAETVTSPVDRTFSVESVGINTNSVEEYDSVRVNPNKTVLSVLSITVPAKLNPGNEFTVETKVKNSGSITANNARAVISLPSGLSLKSGSTAISFGNVGAGAEATASWQVKANVTSPCVKTVSVTARADNADQTSPRSADVNIVLAPITGKDATEKICATFPEETIGQFDECHRGDPVNTSNGAYIIAKKLLAVKGAQTVEFIVHYNSLLLHQGSMGRGWGHNYETRAQVQQNGDIVIYWDNSRKNTFVNNSGIFTPADLANRFDTLEKNGDSYTLTMQDGSSYIFDVAGRLTEHKNGHGQSLAMAYDGAGRLLKVSEPVSGQYLSYAYSSSNKIESVSDRSGRRVSFAYDTSGNLTGITDLDNNTTSFTYYPEGRLLTIKDPDGITQITNNYDEQGRVFSQDDPVPGNQLTRFNYDETSQPGKVVTSVTDRNGNEKVLTYDDKYRLLSVRDELDNTVSYTYDVNGNRITSTDAASRTSSFTYDDRGNLLTVTDPAGRVTRMTYDGKTTSCLWKMPPERGLPSNTTPTTIL